LKTTPVSKQVVERWLRQFAGDPLRANRSAAILSKVVAASALVLVAVTWPLWTPQTVFPRIPFVGALRHAPDWFDWMALTGVLVSLLIILLVRRERPIARWSGLVFIASIVGLVLTDQHRLQPWAYEFVLLLLVLSVLPSREAIVWARLLVISIYVYSALSKLDWTFIESGGGQIVDGLLTFLRLTGDHVSIGQRHVLAGSLAVGELLVGVGLAWRRSRKPALAASVIMHTLLIAALGPWGAGHKAGVLLWNVSFIVQNIVLFGIAGANDKGTQVVPIAAGSETQRSWIGSVLRGAVRATVAIAILFPLTQPFGLCDTWPAWAVYATGPERVRVFVAEIDREHLPAVVRPYLEPPRFRDGRCLVRIDRWSLDATQAPIYPQNRFKLGVALALAAAGRLADPILVEIDGPANRWTGRRETRELVGADEISAELARDWLNGFPRLFANSGDARR
jgi:hypothetical protein